MDNYWPTECNSFSLENGKLIGRMNETSFVVLVGDLLIDLPKPVSVMDTRRFIDSLAKASFCHGH